jgi:pimeloyl-ACP methyl ester carboxylesterase
MKRALQWFAVPVVLLAALSATAQSQEVVDLPTRPGVTERLLVLPNAQPRAVLLLLTGGDGRVGIGNDGAVERRGNFLVRSRERFASQGFAVLVLDTPSDRSDMNGSFRDSAEHFADVGAAVRWAHEKFGKPVWLVGTSRGTQSAAAAALALEGAAAPDGVVLTSTIMGRAPRAAVTARPVNEMPLGTLAMPVLVVHHAQDLCPVCDPSRLPALMAMLPPANSQLLTFTGGRSEGLPCEARSYHGYNGIEDAVVAGIAGWIQGRK